MGHLKLRTWYIEAAVVAAILLVVAYCSDRGYVEFIGAAAVLLTFMHVQIADRLAEAEGQRARLELDLRSLSQRYEHAADKPPLDQVKAAEDRLILHVDCHWKLKWYLIGKELLWLGYFVTLGAWSALVGVGLFLLYPIWRHLYRSWRPIGRS